jgi:hypothetical protein
MTSRDEKPKGIDFEAMEAALKRAAWKAVHGTREERSGRFMPAKRGTAKAGRRVAKKAAAVRREG